MKNFKEFYADTHGVEYGRWEGWQTYHVMQTIADAMAEYAEYVANQNKGRPKLTLLERYKEMQKHCEDYGGFIPNGKMDCADAIRRSTHSPSLMCAMASLLDDMAIELNKNKKD